MSTVQTNPHVGNKCDFKRIYTLFLKIFDNINNDSRKISFLKYTSDPTVEVSLYVHNSDFYHASAKVPTGCVTSARGSEKLRKI